MAARCEAPLWRPEGGRQRERLQVSKMSNNELIPPPKPRRQSSLLDLVKTIVYALLIAGGIRTAAAQPFSIPSESMQGTLLVGDYLFVSKPAYGYSRYSMPFGYALPLPHGRYRLVYEHPVDPPQTDTPDAVRDFTQRCTDVLEMYVRRYPEQWLWMHRRWRNE